MARAATSQRVAGEFGVGVGGARDQDERRAEKWDPTAASRGSSAGGSGPEKEGTL
jgi:hypothetical protein|eukprot:COSAG06_NODE_2582_length_6617_cov_1892.613037_6_plen_55_part_00